MIEVGTRVEIPAHYDEWMQGDRFGVVSLAGVVAHREVVRVTLDKSGKKVRCWADDVKAIRKEGE